MTHPTAASHVKPHPRRPLVAGVDRQQLLVDVVKDRSEVLAQNSNTVQGVNGALKVASGKTASDEDKYYAASTAFTAMEKLAPALHGSAVGAGTSAAMLAFGNDELKKQQDALSTNLSRVLDADQTKAKRSKAAVDAAVGASNVATVAQGIGNAAGNVGKFGLKLAGKLEALAPAVGQAEVLVAKAAATPVGRSVAFLNKWVPLLNITWVGLSVKTAIDVHKDAKASGATRALSIASVGTSTAVFGAGLALSGWAFAGVTAGSVLVDLALAYSRKKDHTA